MSLQVAYNLLLKVDLLISGTKKIIIIKNGTTLQFSINL